MLDFADRPARSAAKTGVESVWLPDSPSACDEGAGLRRPWPGIGLCHERSISTGAAGGPEVMRKHPLAAACVLFATLLGILIPGGWAREDARIEDIEIVREDSYLKASFRVENCFNIKMEEAIWSGVPATFRFLVVLEKPGPLFSGSRLLDVDLEHTLKYDTLKKEFHVSLPESPQRSHYTPRLREAREWMSRVEDLPIIPLWRLEKGSEYHLSVKAELSKVRLPFFLRYIFFFVSLWDFETDWHTVRFDYEGTP